MKFYFVVYETKGFFPCPKVYFSKTILFSRQPALRMIGLENSNWNIKC